MISTFLKKLFPVVLLTWMGCKGREGSPTTTTEAVKDTVVHRAPFTWTHGFADFKAPLFMGVAALPDFKGDPLTHDTAYVAFITKGCRQTGINFGGHYTILHKGCGALCEFVFVVDRITGTIFTDTAFNGGRYGYLYQKDSYLLVANANSFVDDSLYNYSTVFAKPELYVWEGQRFRRMEGGR